LTFALTIISPIKPTESVRGVSDYSTAQMQALNTAIILSSKRKEWKGECSQQKRGPKIKISISSYPYSKPQRDTTTEYK
jgi:hypothetical protein